MVLCLAYYELKMDYVIFFMVTFSQLCQVSGTGREMCF